MSKGAESPQDRAQGKPLPEAWREDELAPGPLCALCAVVVKRVWPGGVTCTVCLLQRRGVSGDGG